MATLTMPVVAGAQQPAKVSRIGFLGASTPANAEPFLKAFRAGLRELGYVEGRDIVIEARSAQAKLERLPALAAELVRLKVDVILVGPLPAAVAAKNATQTVPIVFTAVGDPVETGLVAGLPRPGGNLTGLALISAEPSGKRLQLLKEVVPRASRVAVLWNPDDPGHGLAVKGAEIAARAFWAWSFKRWSSECTATSMEHSRRLRGGAPGPSWSWTTPSPSAGEHSS